MKYKMTDEEAKAFCDTIRQTAYAIHLYLGVGYLEKVYENALVHRLRNLGIDVQTQVPIQVVDEDGYVIGDYLADIVVGGVIVELKAVSALNGAHIAQLLNYLKATGMKHGLLINFGSEKFECRKVVGRP